MDKKAVTNLVAEVARDELREKEAMREQAVEQFRSWIQKHPDIRNCRTDENFLLRFLRVKKFSSPLAHQMLYELLVFITSFSEMTRNLDIFDNAINEIVSSSTMFASPFRDEKGRRVIIFQINRVDPTRVKYKDFGRLAMMTLFSLMEDEAAQVLGFVYVIDYTGATLAQANIFPPLVLRDLAGGAQKTLPMRHKEIHMLNLHPIMQKVVDFCLYAMSNKIRERVYLHQSTDQLHSQVSPKVLPKEFGGSMPGTEMNELWKKEMIGLRDAILAYDSLEIVQTDIKIETGAFRKLNID